MPEDPQYTQLQRLASKLASDFPENRTALSNLPRSSVSESTGNTFIDTRGSPPRTKSGTTPLTHVFVDHSNILIGFLSLLKRNPIYRSRRSSSKFHISHAALALVLERGRSVTRRVMAASSPFYQPLDSAEQLGYEVCVFARVPDTGDRLNKNRRPPSNSTALQTTILVDSDPGQRAAYKPSNHSRTSSSSAALPSTPTIHQQSHAQGNGSGNGNGNGGRVRNRYREQGVDELLQLKLYQAIVDEDNPPPGSTIVLATGDGNIGQYNEDGFVGCVRTALKKGWKVELYAWEEGLSRVWAKEFGDGEWKRNFRIIGLEKYGADLIAL